MRKTLGVLALVVIAGCASAPKSHEFVCERTIASDFDRTWQAVISYAAERNLQIKTLEKASGLIAFERGIVNEADADCGTSGFGKTIERREANVNVFVRPMDGGVSVRVNVSPSVLISSPQFGGGIGAKNLAWQECFSTGGIEGRFLDAIEARARQ